MPACIDEHSAVLDGTQVIIFGGFVDGERVNHVHTLDLETHKWLKIAPADPNAKAPLPRAGHTGSLHEHNLYVFGGKDDENNKLKDLWRFNMIDRVWTKIEVSNPDNVP